MEKATLTLLNWFHISPQVVFMRISIWSLSFWEAERSLCEHRMLSSVNLDHDSGSESLGEGETSVSSHHPRTHRCTNLPGIQTQPANGLASTMIHPLILTLCV